MNDNELKHYGVKGMRWGVRRSSSEIKADRSRRTSSQLSNVRDIANNASSAFRNASGIAGTVGNNTRRPSKKVQKEISAMTDQELSAKIKRINLERQYSDLNPSRTAKGASYARSFLEVAGSVAAIAGSATGIMLAVKQLKG